MKFNLINQPACQMPMQKAYTVSEKDLAENPKQEHITLLRAMLGSLSYLMTWSHPEIVYPVNLLVRYTSKASPALIKQAKKIFRYLSGTKDWGIWFPRNDPLGHGEQLVCYVDASDEDCLLTRRSTGGHVVFWNGVPIAWLSTRQALVTLSTAESEYVQATLACQEVLYLRDMFEGLGIPQDEPTVIYEDNKAAIGLSENQCNWGLSKHIARR
eukprot:213199-Rhodomonas_salina.3